MRRLLSDTAFTGGSHFLISTLQVCLQIFVVRTTVPASFGEYTAALAIETIIESLFIARSGELALQCVGKHWVNGNFPLAHANAVRMIRIDWILNWSFYAIFSVLIYILSNILHVNPYYLVGLALMIPAQIGYGTYKSIFISAHKLKEQAIFESLFMISQLLLGVLGVYFYAIPGLIGALVLSASAKTIVAREITKRWWPKDVSDNLAFSEIQNTIRLESWWSFGFHSVVRNAFASGASQVDILILNAVQGAESVAIYKVAKTLSSLPVKAAGPLWSALRPRIMRAWHYGDRVQMKRLVVLPSTLMFSVLLLSSPFVWFFADDLIILLYGKHYVQATIPFIILLTGSWIFSAMTAWFVFWVIIGEARMSGTIVYGILFAMILCTGIMWGGRSAQDMSLVVAASMLAASMICWLIFFRALKNLHRSTLFSNNPDRLDT